MAAQSITHTVTDKLGLGGDAKSKDMARDTFNVHDSKNKSTTDYGAAVSDQDNWLVATSQDRHGPSLLEDQIAREKVNRFDHERIPERVVHARGAGAFGTFTLFESASDVTYAPILTDTSRKTPMFVRFSTVLGSRGSADTVRDVRGFAIKFYTDEGNWDIVGNNIPVFFINDAMKFPDVVHAAKPEPHNEVPQAQSAHNNFWDFMYLHPETSHMYQWAMSDRTIPRSYRMMQGFGVNTFRLINKDNVAHFVKFHWTPELGVNSLVWDEALKLAGQDPDFHRKDLYEAIDNGCFPKWKFGIQVLPEDKVDQFDFDILDATKLWPEEEIPIRYIGQLELNRNVDEYFTQTEQVAFCTSHIVPGIDFSDDPLLQGRNFSYLDTQMSRLGVNFQQLPVNRPVCPVMNFNRDGQLQQVINKGTVNYWPNRYEAIPPHPAGEGFQSYPEKIAGIKARLKNPKFKEFYNQAQMFHNSLAPHEKAHQLNAFGFELDHCDDPIVYERMSQRLGDIDLNLAKEVADMVGGKQPQQGRPNHGKKFPSLSQTYFHPKEPTIESRRVAVIIGPGFDKADFDAATAAIKAASALPYVIGTKRSPISPDGSGSAVTPVHHLEGFRSTMVDAIYVPGGPHIDTLKQNGRAVHWLREAFAHCKAIGATGRGIELVREACSTLTDSKVKTASSSSSDVVESYGVVTAGKVDPSGVGEAFRIAKEAKDFLNQFFFVISQHRVWARELDGLSMALAY